MHRFLLKKTRIFPKLSGSLMAAGLFLSVLTPSVADNGISGAYVELGAKTAFIPAAYILVEHDAFTVPQIKADVGTIRMAPCAVNGLYLA